ncbi:MAG: hypothetical protein ACUZ8I_07695 [Candidatus Scalindua sp.]
MNGEEFSKLDSKLNKIHIDVVKTKGIVTGHSGRIEACEKDRDVLFDSRNKHENRLTTIETYRKAEFNQDGTERRNKTITFDRIMRILIAVFMLVSIFLLAKKTYGDDRAETVRSLVKVINDHETTQKLGFRFSCKNPDSDRPILDMYTMRSREECLAKEPQLEFLAIAISITWDRILNYKVVYIYDNNNLLVYMINKEGQFIVIGENIS